MTATPSIYVACLASYNAGMGTTPRGEEMARVKYNACVAWIALTEENE